MVDEEIIILSIVSVEIIVSIFVLAPLALYFQKQFAKISHLAYIQKRHPRILKIQGIFVVSWFIFGGPLLALDFAHLNHEKTVDEIITRVNWVTSQTLSLGFFVTLAWRFWHIFYDLKYSSSQKNSEWKYHLDPSLVEHNFWLTHKKNYGSSAWTQKYVIIWYITTLVVFIVTYQSVINTYYFFIGHIVSTIGHSVASTAVLFLACKVPQYNDHFFVKYELKTIYLQLLVIMSISSCAAAVGVFVPLVMMVIGLCATVLFIDITLVSYWWIPRKIVLAQFHLKMLQQKTAKIESVQTTTIGSSVGQGKHTIKPHHLKQIIPRLSGLHMHSDLNVKPKKRSYNLHALLSHEKSFKIFMQHLAAEFSTECLLCFVEIMQFKFLMKERFDIIDPSAIKEQVNFSDKYPLYHVVPLSIINREEFEQDLSKYRANDDPINLTIASKKAAARIYFKYMKIGAELEVNVSYEVRSRLTNLMNQNESFWMQFNITTNELFCLYDDTAVTLLNLMDGSFVRFKHSAAFPTAINTFTH